MSNNRYGGVDSYAAFFIAYKARTLIRMPIFTDDDFEDIQQELMIAYLHAWPNFDPRRGDRRSFIKAAVNNAASNLVRDAENSKRWQGSRPLSLDAPINEDQDSLLDVMSADDGFWGASSGTHNQKLWEETHDFMKFIDSLPKDLREISLLLIEHSAPDISHILQIPIQTIYSRIKRLRKIIQEK